MGEICEVVRGGSPRPAGSEIYYNGNIPFLKVADLTKDESVYVSCVENSIKEAGLQKTRFVKRGTLLLTNSGATLGVPKITTIDTTFNDGIAAFLGLCENIKLYCYWFLKASTARFRAINQGAGQPNLNTDLIKATHIPIPPQNEQKRIVFEIEKLFAIIDEIESNKNNLQETIQQTKSKILELAIHGQLVSQDLTDEPASVLLKRIAPNATLCDTSHYENIPDSWVVCKLEDIVDYEQPTQYIVESTNYSDDYEIPVLTAGKSFILGYTNETNGIYRNLPAIIFDDFTTDSRLVDFPFKVKSSAMKILQVRPEINIKYVAYFMSIIRLVGDTHKRYWISEYSKIQIPIPPKQEQDRIVNAIESVELVLTNIIADL